MNEFMCSLIFGAGTELIPIGNIYPVGVIVVVCHDSRGDMLARPLHGGPEVKVERDRLSAFRIVEEEERRQPSRSHNEARDHSPEGIREFGRRLRAKCVPKGLLTNRTTVEEAEAKHMSDLGLGDNVPESVRRARLEFARSRSIPLTGKPVPFGFLYCEWREMINSIQEGDELWEFCSPKCEWEHLAGMAGIALVRRGEVVDAIITSMN
jgi:hypothetical protein